MSLLRKWIDTGYGKEYEYIELEGVGHQIRDQAIKYFEKSVEYIEKLID